MTAARISDCKWCGRRIQFRQMPHGRFVAWDLTDDEPHICPSKGTPPTGGKVVRRTPVEPTPWLAVTPAASVPPLAPALDASPKKVSGRDYYRSRRDAALAGLAIHRFTGPQWSAKLRTHRATASVPGMAPLDASDPMAPPGLRSVSPARPAPPIPLWRQGATTDRVSAATAPAERAVAEASPWYDAHAGPPTPPDAPDPASDLDSLVVRLLRPDPDEWVADGKVAGGPVQAALDVASPGATIRLSAGRLPGRLLASASVTIEGAGRDATWLVATDGSALLVDGDVTVRGMTLGTMNGRSAVIVRSGSLWLEDCVVAGEVGVMIGSDAGPVVLSDCRLVCPRGGCGIVAAAHEYPMLHRVDVAVHRGLGLLRLRSAAAAEGVSFDGLSVVGDESVAVDSARPERPGTSHAHWDRAETRHHAPARQGGHQ